MTGTPFLGHDPIVMRRVDDYDLVERAGDFWWTTGSGRVLWVALPSAEFRFQISLWHIDSPNESGHQWGWDGDVDAPSLSPSLHAVGFWHGWVRGGRLIEAGWVDASL